MKNEKYREYIKKTGFKQWRIAEILGISEGTLCKMLREQLPENVLDGLINIVKSEIMGTPYSIDFFDEYRKERYIKIENARIANIRKNKAAYKLYLQVERGLDEAEQRRMQGGWDLSI